MTRHPRMSELERFAARESGTRVSRHLAACAACRADVGWIRDVRAAFGGSSPLTAPAAAWPAIAHRIGAGDIVVLPSAPSTAASARRTRWRAAALLVLAASGGVYAMPGSPLRTVVERAVGRVFGSDATSTTPPVGSAAHAPAAVAPATPAASFVVHPSAGQVLVAVDSASPDVRIRLRWIDDGGFEVRATGAAALARFTSGPGRITISAAAGGELLLVVPRNLRRAALTVGGVPYLVQEGGSVTITASAADTIGGEVVLILKDGVR